uniref:Bcl-2 homologous antagonist/killer n=1 Tax=Callithrix jacchus TaxID=9483 RepID=A0A5F4WJG4_CALJA
MRLVCHHMSSLQWEPGFNPAESLPSASLFSTATFFTAIGRNRRLKGRLPLLTQRWLACLSNLAGELQPLGSQDIFGEAVVCMGLCHSWELGRPGGSCPSLMAAPLSCWAPTPIQDLVSFLFSPCLPLVPEPSIHVLEHCRGSPRRGAQGHGQLGQKPSAMMQALAPTAWPPAHLPASRSHSTMGQVGRQLAIIGDDINRRYDSEFQTMLQHLQPTAENAYEYFTKIASSLFESGINWGRVVALLGFGYRLALHVYQRGLTGFLGQVTRFVVDFMLHHCIARWIAQRGGWVAALDLGNGPILNVLVVLGVVLLGQFVVRRFFKS